MIVRWCVPLIALVASGCSVAGLSERDSGIATNECGQDKGCPEGEVCSALGCIATSGALSTLLFEVSPGIASNNAAGAQFFTRADAIPLVPTATSLGGSFQRQFFSLALSEVVTVSGSLNAASCNVLLSQGGSSRTVTNAAIPARITFAPSERMWGLATSTASLSADSADNGYTFRASLPGGTYDVYVEPLGVVDPNSAPSKSCAVLPQLFRAQDLNGSTSLKLSLPVPKHLDLKLRFPEGNQDLDGWQIDMIEPVTGRVISNVVELELPTRSDGTLTYSAALEYIPVWGDDPNITHGELVRVAPPAKLTAPTLFFWREGLEWASPGSGVIDQFTAYPSAVSFTGRVSDPDKNGVSATVTLTATEVSGVSSGLFPSFIRNTETDADGRFQVNLPPGSYKAIAAPHNAPSTRPLAIATTRFTVLPEPEVQAGTTLSLRPAFSVQGSVLTPSREGARGALVSAELSPALDASTVFERAIGEIPIVPRGASDVIQDESGAFQFFAEPGTYDFSVRPPEGSGFAWLVMPGFEPARGAAADTLELDLAELHLPAPLPLELHVAWPGRTDSAELLTGASVRAYALIDATGAATTDAKAAASAVRVAEGRIDGAGQVTLMLPAKLDRPPEGYSSTSADQP